MGNKYLGQRQNLRFGYLFVAMFVVLLPFLAVGCKKDPKLEFIQGLWYYNDAHLANIPGESAQVTSWAFDRGTFFIDSCCFTESHFSGRYYVSESEDDKLTLELFNLSGQNGDNVLSKEDELTLVIKINTQTDTIQINRDGPYSRIYSP
jgi:hypothetical protein